MTKTGSFNDGKVKVEIWKGQITSATPVEFKPSSAPITQLPNCRIRNRSSMGLPRVREFGCGISVRTGAILIAVFSLIGGIMMCAPALICGKDFIEFFKNVNDSSNKVNSERLLSFDNFDDLSVAIKQPNDDESAQLEVAYVILDTVIAFGIYHIVISLLLLLGIKKEIRGCMIPWLITQGLCCIFSVLLLLFVLFLPAIISEYYATYPLIGIYSYFSQLLTTFISTAVSLHMFFVVHTQYKNLKQPSQGFTPFENF